MTSVPRFDLHSAYQSNTFDAIPLELRNGKQYVVWKYLERNGRPTKVPFTPGTRKMARADDPSTWRTFEQAITAYNAGGWDGIGREFATDDKLVGIDLDKCRDPLTGSLLPWARVYVHLLNSYTEISPSGTGLRIFVKGDLPPLRRKQGPVEVYNRVRYLTLTGNRLKGTLTTVEERSDELTAFHRLVFGDQAKPENSAPRAASRPVDLDSAKLLERALSANRNFAQLHAGDLNGKPSPSEAEMAYFDHAAFWTGGDQAMMIEWYRTSSLYREGKGDRQDYLDRTIEKAIAGCIRFYDPHQATDWLPAPTTPPIAVTTPANPCTGDLVCITAERLAALETAESERNAILTMLANKKLDADARIMSAFMAFYVPRQRDANKPLFAKAVAPRLGFSERRAGAALKTLSAGGVLERHTQYVTPQPRIDKSTGEIKALPPVPAYSYTLGAPTTVETLKLAARLVPEDPKGQNWGGKREKGRCLKHPHAAVDFVCRECHERTGEALPATIPFPDVQLDYQAENDAPPHCEYIDVQLDYQGANLPDWKTADARKAPAWLGDADWSTRERWKHQGAEQPRE